MWNALKLGRSGSPLPLVSANLFMQYLPRVVHWPSRTVWNGRA